MQNEVCLATRRMLVIFSGKKMTWEEMFFNRPAAG